MPSFLIVSSQQRKAGQSIDAILCGPGITGSPDRKSGTPVKATIAERTITIDNEPRPRSIISTVGQNGVITYLIDGSTKQLRNRERRTALGNALSQLNQLTKTLRPLIATSDDKLASEGLGLLFNWIHDERERLTEDQLD
jgi:hypothetical protein